MQSIRPREQVAVAFQNRAAGTVWWGRGLRSQLVYARNEGHLWPRPKAGMRIGMPLLDSLLRSRKTSLQIQARLLGQANTAQQILEVRVRPHELEFGGAFHKHGKVAISVEERLIQPSKSFLPIFEIPILKGDI